MVGCKQIATADSKEQAYSKGKGQGMMNLKITQTFIIASNNINL